jgi:hypothetical protein
MSDRISVRCYFLCVRFQHDAVFRRRFSVVKFLIMKQKWCDISGSHSGVSEDLNFFCGVTVCVCVRVCVCVCVCVWVFPTFRNIRNFMVILKESKKTGTV